MGGGIEVAMTQRWTARLDYSYQNYGTFKVKGSGTFAGGVPVIVLQPGETRTYHTRVAIIGSDEADALRRE